MKFITQMSLDLYRAMDEVHNIGSFLCLREALRVMTAQSPEPSNANGASNSTGGTRGSIVLVTSLASKGGYQGSAGYTAAKHAVEGLIQSAGK